MHCKVLYVSNRQGGLKVLFISRDGAILSFFMNKQCNTCVIPYKQTAQHLCYSVSTDCATPVLFLINRLCNTCGIPYQQTLSLVLFNRRCNSRSRSSFLINSVTLVSFLLPTVGEILSFCSFFLQWGTADAEINVPSVENSELTKYSPLKA